MAASTARNGIAPPAITMIATIDDSAGEGVGYCYIDTLGDEAVRELLALSLSGELLTLSDDHPMNVLLEQADAACA